MGKKRILVVGGSWHLVLTLNVYLQQLELDVPAEVFSVASIKDVETCGWVDMILFPVLVGWDDTINFAKKLQEQQKPFAVLVNPISATFQSLYEGVSGCLFWEWNFVKIAQHIKEVLGLYK